MYLTIDIGNTTINLGIHNKKLITFEIASDKKKTSDEYFMAIKPLFIQYEIKPQDIKYVAISSVVDEITSDITMMCQKFFSCSIYHLTKGVKTGIDLAIDNASELGNDLLASAIGAKELSSQEPFCVVDFGTATTLSLVNKKNQFLGVSIMPGLKQQFSILNYSTSKLPKINSTKINKIIGKNTHDAILSGVIIGQACAINNFVSNLQSEYKDLVIFITGGYSVFLLEHLNFSYNTQPHLIHIGLKKLINLNCGKIKKT